MFALKVVQMEEVNRQRVECALLEKNRLKKIPSTPSSNFMKREENFLVRLVKVD